MKRIGLLSDTHAFWDERYLEYFASCDEIWHAGDIGSYQLIQRLADFKPVKAVYGNCDGQEVRQAYPQTLQWETEGARIMMTHIGGYPGKYQPGVKQELIRWQPQLLIAGHSHILKVQFDHSQNLLYINPGAAGIMGWHKQRTLVRFTIDRGKFRDLEVIELGQRQTP